MELGEVRHHRGLAHLHHGVEHALGRRRVATHDRVGEGAWRDLPGETPFVLAPAAGALLATVADDRVPQAIGFGLVVGGDLEREGFVVGERGAPVESDARCPFGRRA